MIKGLAAVGVAGLAWSALVERNAFHVAHRAVPCLATGSASMRVLHLSDTHLLGRQRRKRAFIAGLARLRPDLVVHTGDTLAGPSGVAAAQECFAPLLAFPGAFCLGSNDYYAPVAKNPALYLDPHHQREVGQTLDWEPMAKGWVDGGWVDLDNARATLTLADGRTVDARGVDDPHLRRHDLAAAAGAAAPGADLVLGLVHAPEPTVYDAFVADGVQLLLSGHTHGGQLRLPGYGALVTNCGIDRARARGVSRYGSAWMHVSPGLGTSPWAPVRFACRPEATLLTLEAAPAGR